jgi:hypothetical protein
MKNVCLLVITALLLCFPRLSFATDKIIPLKDNKGKDSDYSSVLCFRFSVTDKGRIKTKMKLKDQPNKKLSYSINYFNGSKLATIYFVVNGYIKDNIIYSSDIVYLAAIPGKYELVGIDYTITNDFNYISTYVFPINAALELNAGKAYYAGEVIINEDENQKLTGNLFNNIIINQPIISDFENRYPNTFNNYKNDLVPATFIASSPLQPTNVAFSSRFTKDEGKWRESNDSLHTASFENGQYCIESKSSYNMGSEVIELPEKLGNSFDIELHCTWKNGGNAAFGLIIPSKGAPLAPRVELEPAGYIFGITANGYACVWFDQVPLMLSKVKKIVALTDWKKIPNFKINDSGQNSIRLQVIDKVISFYVNDILVVRSPVNNESVANKTEFLYSNSNLLGIFSYNKQKIEFNEIKFSKFK